MSITFDDEITKFVRKHLSLIEEERKEECDQSQQLIKLSYGGVNLKNLTLNSYASCLGGYVLAEFRSTKNKVLPSHNLCRGDVVGVIEGIDLQNTQIATGVVKYCKDEIIAVSFEDVNFNEDNVYSLVKLANDITYSRLKYSLKTLISIDKYKARTLAELLFGNKTDLEQLSLPASILNESGDIKYVNLNLHADQKDAVKFALAMKNLAVIHGPPGTGKTTTLVEIILQMITMGNKLLVCAPSNVAVDNLIEKLSHHHVRMVRLGHPARVMESTSRYSLDVVVDTSSSSQIVRDVRKELNDVLKKLKSKRCKDNSRFELRNEMKNLRKELHQRESRALKEVLAGADVVLSTLVTASDNGPLKQLPEEHFNCVIIDECSQALEAACWIALPRGNKAILAGDHLQLPPTILSKKAEQEGLGLSLMERVVKKFGKEVYKLLTRQFRMHTDIMNWPSNMMYEGKLEADASVANHLLKDLPSVNTTDETEMSLLFVDTADSQFEEEAYGTSLCNRGEAGIVSVIVKRLASANVEQSSIAVITPYNFQVEMIRSYIDDLKGVEVRSVDGFQGREKEAVILSMVRSNPQRELGFIADRRRLNVAVSRARRFLCIVADSRTVSHDKTLGSLLDYITENGIVHTADQYLSSIETPKEVLHNKKFQSSKSLNETKSEKTSEKTRNKKKTQNKVQKVFMKNNEQAQENQNKNLNCVIEENDQWYSILYKFSNSNQRELKFSNSVSASDRRLIHMAAEKLGLVHVSSGEGSERCIVVSKPSNINSSEQNKVVKEKNISLKNNSEKLIANTVAINCSVKATSLKEIDPKSQKVSDLQDESTPLNVSNINEKKAVQATKSKRSEKQNNEKTMSLKEVDPKSQEDSVIIQDDESTHLNISNINENKVVQVNKSKNSDKQTKKSSNEVLSKKESDIIRDKESTPRKMSSDLNRNEKNPTERTESRKSEKLKKKSRKREEPEDFDALVAEFQEMNRRCHWSNCKIPTEMVGLTCIHCKKRFCLSHGLPELHGCGEAARKMARQTFRNPRPSKPDPLKRNAASRKLEKKLHQMAEERKPRKKEN